MSTDRPRARGGAARWRALVGVGVLALMGLCAVAQGAEPELLDAASRAVDEGRLDVAERLLSDGLAIDPEDAASRFLRARVRSWAGQWDDARSDYERLLQRDAGNADYLLGQAQVLLWSGSPREAVAVARRARTLAPDYEALWRLELTALLASGDTEARSAAEGLVIDARQRFPDSSWPLPEQAPAASAAYLQIGATVVQESLGSGFADWRSTVVEAEHRSDRGRALYGRVRATERFGLRDREIVGGTHLSVAGDWVAGFELSYSPTAEVLPAHALTVSMQRPLPGGWGVSASARRAVYSDTRADLLSGGVERYWRDFRFGYQLFRGKADGANATFSHAVRTDWYYRDGSSAGLMLVKGREQESVGGGRLITTQVQAFALLGEHRVTPGWALTWGINRHRQGAIYRRDGISVGFRHRF